jgi:hypothetical protein
MTDRIELRRDSAADWTTANPVLAEGEPGVELDTGFLKIGDGVTAWTALDYFGAGSGLTAEDVRDIIGATLTGAGGIVVTPDDAGDSIEIDGSGISGGGGGGGFGGQYAAGSHAPGELLAYGPYLWTPRTTTSTPPGVDAGSISGYTANGPTGAISGDIATLIDHAASGSGSIWAPSAITGWQSLSLAATVYAGDRADGFWFGYCDPAASIANSNVNAPGVASFTGVGWDVYNGGLSYWINGTAIVNYGSRWGTLERWQDLCLDFSVAGGNLTMRLNGGVKVTATAPSWTTGRVYAHGQSGGANGTFKVRGRPIAFDPASANWRRISTLVDQT